ncbi:MAG TPA: hypothetical protein VFN35_17530 [Ktedonobacteraceae bacterium]|nr:hypothetical protein [Ktedonobacteraceae bacterium]
MLHDGRTLYNQVRDAYYSETAESELELARLSQEAMETMEDDEWEALCAELLGAKGGQPHAS